MSKYFCECSNKKSPDEEMCQECANLEIKRYRYNVMKDGVKEKMIKGVTVNKRQVPKDFSFGTLPWLIIYK